MVAVHDFGDGPMVVGGAVGGVAGVVRPNARTCAIPELPTRRARVTRKVPTTPDDHHRSLPYTNALFRQRGSIGVGPRSQWWR